MSRILYQIGLPLLCVLSTTTAQLADNSQELIQPQTNLNVYLAGPGVFLPADVADSTARSEIAFCESLGLVPLHPLREVILQEDSQLPANVLSPDNRTANDWYLSDLGKIEMSAGIIAEITSFRGSSMDPGTAFELGYATARGLKVVLWSETNNTIWADRVNAQQKLGDDHGIPDLGTGKWTSIDETPATENLMITRPETPVYSTFEDAAAKMAQVLKNGASDLSFRRRRKF